MPRRIFKLFYFSIVKLTLQCEDLALKTFFSRSLRKKFLVLYLKEILARCMYIYI